jgi:hypothetical protein
MVDHKEQVKEILCSKLFLINNNKMFLLYEFFKALVRIQFITKIKMKNLSKGIITLTEIHKIQTR